MRNSLTVVPAATVASPAAANPHDTLTDTAPSGLVDTLARPAKHAKRALSKLPVQAQASDTDATAAADPAVGKAVIGVLGLEDLMNQSTELCQRTLPTSFGTYADTADAWHARNGAILSGAHALLEKSLAMPRAVEAALKLRNKNSLAPVADSNLGARIKWCDQSVASLNHGEMDPKDRPALAGPLLGGR